MSVARLMGSCWLMLALAGTAAGASVIADAAMNKDRAAVRSLLQRQANVNMPQPDGATALHWAVRWDDAEMADMLIRAGANVGAASRLGVTPLSLACVNGSASMIEKLLRAGVNPNSVLSDQGETALMMSARTGKADAVKVLIDHGADVNAKERSKGQTALMWAASERHPAVVKLLIEHRADVNAHSNVTAVAQRPVAQNAAQASAGGITALLLAARQNDLESARILLAAGADVNLTMADGTSALLLAILNAHYELAAFLLDWGADPNRADNKGRAALYAAVAMRNYTATDVPAPKPDNYDVLKLIKVLLDNGADPNARLTARLPFRGGSNRTWLTEPGSTPFYRAAASGDITLMRVLLAYGADPNTAASDNSTPLMVAAGVGFLPGYTHEWPESDALQALEFCLRLGNDVSAVNARGLTALHGAAFKGWNAAIKVLVNAGARLDATDAQGRTPLNWADGVYRGGGIAPVRQPQTIAFLQQLMDSGKSR